MKKGLIMLIIFILVGCDSSVTETPNANDRVGSRDGQELKAGSGTQSNQPSATITIHVTDEQVTRGNLVLVNKDYPLDPEAVPEDIVTLFENHDLMHGYVVLNNKIRLSRGVAEHFRDMIGAAGEDGVNHFLISSGYRDEDEQEELYREKGSDYALPPGYSEHNLGLSMDIGSTQQSIDRSPEGTWLKEHAWAHGFILRYPQDKTEITGIQYEPWHFRYVGQPHSMIMKELNLTLEEYLDYLKDKSSYRTTVEGDEYEVKYVPVTSKDVEIEIPAESQYEISGTNMDGIIVTVKLNKDETQ